MHTCGASFGLPFTPAVFEIPNVFFLFAVYRDGWLPGSYRFGDPLGDVVKLLIAVRMGFPVLVLCVLLKGVPLLVQESKDRTIVDLMSHLPQSLRQLRRTLRAPEQHPLRITPGLRVNQQPKVFTDRLIGFGDRFATPSRVPATRSVQHLKLALPLALKLRSAAFHRGTRESCHPRGHRIAAMSVAFSLNRSPASACAFVKEMSEPIPSSLHPRFRAVLFGNIHTATFDAESRNHASTAAIV
jgi:hypothetical protein